MVHFDCTCIFSPAVCRDVKAGNILLATDGTVQLAGMDITVVRHIR